MRMLLLMCAAVLALGTLSAAEEVGTARIDVVPADPAEGDEIGLVLSGAWPDSCVPHSYQLLRLGSFINISLATRDEDCMSATTEWEMEVALGQLSAGSYLATVSHEGDTIGQATFNVREEATEPGPPSDDDDYWDIPGEEGVDCENPYFPPLVMLLSTVEGVPMGASLPVSLVVTTTAGEHAFLFTSGQRYDFAVYKEGEEVWRWSDDQAFTMDVGEHTYGMDGTLYFERLNTSELPGPGEYTLQATVATEGMVEDSSVTEHGPAHTCTTFVVYE